MRCVFESVPSAGITQTCDTAGVIGPIVSVIAAMKVAEALKLLSGAQEHVSRKIATVHMWHNQHDLLNLHSPNPDCSYCAKHEFTYLDGTPGAAATSLCGRNSVQIRRREGAKIDLKNWRRWAKWSKTVFFCGQFDGYQLTVFSDGRAIINGTDDFGLAKLPYARYFG